jgi:hypothetical protein
MFEAGRGNTSQCVSKECRSDLRGIAGLEGILIGPLGIRGLKMGFDYSRGIEGLGGSPLLSWYRMIGMGLLLGEEGSEWISTDLRVSTASVSPGPC